MSYQRQHSLSRYLNVDVMFGTFYQVDVRILDGTLDMLDTS